MIELIDQRCERRNVAVALDHGGDTGKAIDRLAIQAPYVLGHRIWLGPHAASHGLTTDDVIRDVVEEVSIP